MAMSIAILLVLSLFVLPLLFLFLRPGQKKSKLNLPPGPKPLPIIGNLHQVGNLLHVAAHELSKRYGPIVHLRLGQIPAIVISSPALAKEVLKTQDLAFCSRPAQTSFMKYTSNGCDVAAAPYGDSWRMLRKLFVIELLSVKKLREFQVPRQEETDKLIHAIAARPDPNAPVNLTDVVFTGINNFVFRIAFGYKSEGVFGERSRIHKILDKVNILIGREFYAGDFFPGFGWIDVLTGLRKRLESSAKEMDDFLQEIIDQHMDPERRNAQGFEEDFVDVMIQLWKDGNKDFTVEHVKGLIVDVLVAASDTSATTIVWAMTDLIMNPSAMKKAQDEVRSVVGSKGKVEQSDLQNLSYLKLVINESMRLHSQMLITRETMQDCKIDGYDVAAKTWVFINSWAIGRHKETWERAEEFIPERFIGSDIEYKGNNFELLPFGSGRRICPGMNFGIASVELSLASLLYAFNWELPNGVKVEDLDMSEEPGFVIRRKCPLNLVARNNWEVNVNFHP